MRFLVALTLLATVYGSIPDECASGDSYTCSSLATAHECGTFQHCMDTVWKNAKLEKDTTDVCQFCEAIIKDVRAFVDDKHNEDEVKTFLTNACNVIPDPTLADLCKTSVTEEFDELIKMIDSELDPATVCSAMGLCSGFKKAVLQQKQSALKDGTDVCEFCEAIIKDIRSFVDDKANQDQVKDMLKSVCKLISDQEISNLCMTAVDDEFAMLIQMIDSELDPSEVCKAMQLCAAKKQLAAGSMCPECTKFFMEVKSKLSDASTQKEIEQLIEDQLCTRLGQFKALCQFGVESYLQQIIQTLSSDVDPSEICSALEFCPSTPEAHTLLAQHRLQLSQSFGAVQAPRVAGAGECYLCKQGMEELQDLERNKTLHKTAIYYIEKYSCKLMYGPEMVVCQALVEIEIPDIFALLVNETNPETRCTELGFCHAQSVEAVLRTALPKSPPPKVPVTKAISHATAHVAAPSTECVLCEYVIQTIDNQLGDNATEEEIIKALDEVCDVLPDTIKETCEQFVAQYGPTVIALLLQELDPQQVCTKLGLCSALRTSSECVLCQFVMTQIDQILENNSTEAEIIAALDKVCKILPSSVTKDCLDFVNTYGPAVIALLEQELDPAEICGILGLCPGQKKETLHFVKATPEECDTCETIIWYLENLVSQNSSIEFIEDNLVKTCNYVPESMKQKCAYYMDQYADVMVENLGSFDPRKVCVMIHRCNQTHSEESNSVKMAKLVPAKTHMLGKVLLQKTAVAGNEECGICETVMQYLESLLEENATIVQIEQAMDKICNFLPDTMKQQCDDMVKQYGPLIIQMVASSIDPKTICTEIGLCSKTHADESNSVEVEQEIVPVKVHMLGENECTQGPAMWCLNMKNAVKCNTVEHCKLKVWN